MLVRVSTAKCHSMQGKVEAKIKILRYTLDQIGVSAKALPWAGKRCSQRFATPSTIPPFANPIIPMPGIKDSKL